MFYESFRDELVKLSGTLSSIKEIAKEDPSNLIRVLKAMTSGPGSSLARGLVYGSAGYGSMKGLGYRNKETRKREPLTGALRGAAKGALIGLPLAALLRYPAMRREIARLGH